MMSVAAASDVFQAERLVDLVASLADARAFAVNARVERWALDEGAIAGRLFDDTAEFLYRADSLVRGSWRFLDG